MKKIICIILTLFITMNMCACQTIIDDISNFIVYDIGQYSFYETTDIVDYGNYIGNFDKETPAKLINEFFPEIIEDYFYDVKYSYRAEQLDAYAFEAYLEFSIEDSNTYQEYKATVTKDRIVSEFPYGNGYEHCVINDLLRLHHYVGKKEYTAMNHVDFRQILFHDDTQTIIYIAIGDYDGGGARLNEITTFFTKFNIDPLTYPSADVMIRDW